MSEEEGVQLTLSNQVLEKKESSQDGEKDGNETMAVLHEGQ